MSESTNGRTEDEKERLIAGLVLTMNKFNVPAAIPTDIWNRVQKGRWVVGTRRSDQGMAVTATLLTKKPSEKE